MTRSEPHRSPAPTKPPSGPRRQAREPPSPTLPITEKNRFLIEGDLADVVALYNAGAKAPHVALNLRGEFVFADDRANVCLFGPQPRRRRPHHPLGARAVPP